MKISCGTDIVEIERIKKAMSKNGVFTDRIFTSSEKAYCISRKAGQFQSFAARFAAKESVSKAFGTGMGESAQPLEIEITNDEMGKPSVRLSGKALETFEKLNGKSIEISLSHSHDYAVAFAVITFRETK